MTNIRDIAFAKVKGNKQFEQNRTVLKCVTIEVDTAGSSSVANRDGYIWVKEFNLASGAFQAFSPFIQPLIGLPVFVASDPKPPYRRMVIGVDWDTVVSMGNFTPGSPYLVNHHETHEWPDGAPGGDVVQVYLRALVPLRTYWTGAFTVGIAPTVYIYNGDYKKYTGGILDLTSYIPSTAGNAVMLLLYLDAVTNVVTVLPSAEFLIGGVPTYPDPLVNTIPSAWIYLDTSMTALSETYIFDARVLFEIVDAAATVDAAAILEAEMDLIISRHVVEGV